MSDEDKIDNDFIDYNIDDLYYPTRAVNKLDVDLIVNLLNELTKSVGDNPRFYDCFYPVIESTEYHQHSKQVLWDYRYKYDNKMLSRAQIYKRCLYNSKLSGECYFWIEYDPFEECNDNDCKYSNKKHSHPVGISSSITTFVYKDSLDNYFVNIGINKDYAIENSYHDVLSVFDMMYTYELNNPNRGVFIAHLKTLKERYCNE